MISQKSLVWVASCEQVRCDCGQEQPIPIREQTPSKAGTVGQSLPLGHIAGILHEYACAIHTENCMIAVVIKWSYLIE